MTNKDKKGRKKKRSNRPTKKKKGNQKVSCGPSFGWEGGKKEKPARPHNWSGFLKEFLSPVSMGRTPAEQLQRQAMAPHERFLPGGGEANDLIAKKVNCFPAERQKAQEELHHGVWDISKYLTDFSIMKKPPSSFFFLRRGFVFPPTADPSHSHQAPWLARVIVWAPRVQSEPFRSRSVCADTM